MRGGKREKKMLHEHEAFLFVFTFVFLFGGFIFWGHSANAVEYFIDGKSIDEGNQFYTLPGEEKLVDLILRNSLPGEEADMAVVIYEADINCDKIVDEIPVVKEEEEEFDGVGIS